MGDVPDEKKMKDPDTSTVTGSQSKSSGTAPPATVVPIPTEEIPRGFGPKLKDLSPEKAAGVGFLRFLLWVVTIVVIFQLVVLVISSWHYWCLSSSYYQKFINSSSTSTNLTVDTLKSATDTLQTQQKSFQDFWMQSTQFVLSGVFLPLITALLGYIFGTKEASLGEPKNG